MRATVQLMVFLVAIFVSMVGLSHAGFGLHGSVGSGPSPVQAIAPCIGSVLNCSNTAVTGVWAGGTTPCSVGQTTGAFGGPDATCAPPPVSTTVQGSGYLFYPTAVWNRPQRMWINAGCDGYYGCTSSDSMNFCVAGQTADPSRGGIDHVTFYLEGNEIIVNNPVMDPETSELGYCVKPKSPTGLDGDAYLVADVYPTNGPVYRLPPMALTLNNHGSISRTQVYINGISFGTGTGDGTWTTSSTSVPATNCTNASPGEQVWDTNASALVGTISVLGCTGSIAPFAINLTAPALVASSTSSDGLNFGGCAPGVNGIACGNDTTGTGSISAPYATVGNALNKIGVNFGAYVTVAAGSTLYEDVAAASALPTNLSKIPRTTTFASSSPGPSGVPFNLTRTSRWENSNRWAVLSASVMFDTVNVDNNSLFGVYEPEPNQVISFRNAAWNMPLGSGYSSAGPDYNSPNCANTSPVVFPCLYGPQDNTNGYFLAFDLGQGSNTAVFDSPRQSHMTWSAGLTLASNFGSRAAQTDVDVAQFTVVVAAPSTNKGTSKPLGIVNTYYNEQVEFPVRVSGNLPQNLLVGSVAYCPATTIGGTVWAQPQLWVQLAPQTSSWTGTITSATNMVVPLSAVNGPTPPSVNMNMTDGTNIWNISGTGQYGTTSGVTGLNYTISFKTSANTPPTFPYAATFNNGSAAIIALAATYNAANPGAPLAAANSNSWTTGVEAINGPVNVGYFTNDNFQYAQFGIGTTNLVAGAFMPNSLSAQNGASAIVAPSGGCVDQNGNAITSGTTIVAAGAAYAVETVNGGGFDFDAAGSCSGVFCPDIINPANNGAKLSAFAGAVTQRGLLNSATLVSASGLCGPLTGRPNCSPSPGDSVTLWNVNHPDHSFYESINGLQENYIQSIYQASLLRGDTQLNNWQPYNASGAISVTTVSQSGQTLTADTFALTGAPSGGSPVAGETTAVLCTSSCPSGSVAATWATWTPSLGTGSLATQVAMNGTVSISQPAGFSGSNYLMTGGATTNQPAFTVQLHGNWSLILPAGANCVWQVNTIYDDNHAGVIPLCGGETPTIPSGAVAWTKVGATVSFVGNVTSALAGLVLPLAETSTQRVSALVLTDPLGYGALAATGDELIVGPGLNYGDGFQWTLNNCGFSNQAFQNGEIPIGYSNPFTFTMSQTVNCTTQTTYNQTKSVGNVIFLADALAADPYVLSGLSTTDAGEIHNGTFATGWIDNTYYGSSLPFETAASGTIGRAVDGSSSLDSAWALDPQATFSFPFAQVNALCPSPYTSPACIVPNSQMAFSANQFVDSNNIALANVCTSRGSVTPSASVYCHFPLGGTPSVDYDQIAITTGPTVPNNSTEVYLAGVGLLPADIGTFAPNLSLYPPSATPDGSTTFGWQKQRGVQGNAHITSGTPFYPYAWPNASGIVRPIGPGTAITSPYVGVAQP